MLSLQARQQGMSLIEVMTAITIAALLMAIAAPSFITGTQNRQIRSAADAIQNGVSIAKTEALKRNRNVTFQLRDDNSWTVGCETVDATVVAGEQVCPAEIQKREKSEGSVNVQTDLSEVVASTGSAASSTLFSDNKALTFTPLGRVTTTTVGAGNNAVIKVSNPPAGTCVAAGGQMRCLTIIVTNGGQVRMCDPAVAAGSGDPRAC